MGYLVKACRSQITEERHKTFSNLLLKGKFHEAVRFVCYREKGVFFQPNELAGYSTVTINKIVASVLYGGNPSETIPSCATLETYEETPNFIPIDITEEAVDSVARKI